MLDRSISSKLFSLLRVISYCFNDTTGWNLN